MSDTEKSKSEDRDQQILRRLSNIEHKVDSLEQTTAFALRADADRHFGTVKTIFRGQRRAQVYLAANGRRSVNDIGSLLTMKGPNVSSELTKLAEEGLLEVLEKDGGTKYWGKKAVDRNLRISKFLMETYHLDRNGIPVTRKKT